MATLEFDQGLFHLEQGSQPVSSILTPYQRRMVQFCQQYLKGQPEFQLQTSGSTGTPKSITITHRQMQASAQLTIQTLGLSEGDRFLICLNTDFIGGKMMLVRGMELNAHMKIIPPKTSLLDYEPVDFIALVPLQIYALLASVEGLQFLESCSKVIIGGAPLHQQAAQVLCELSNDVYQTFGMTETVSHFALKKVSDKKPGPFKALPEVDLRLDKRGCLVVKGPMTDFQEVFTNDLVELMEEGQFEWIGRFDEVINSGGYKAYPPKISQAVGQVLERMGYDLEFVVFGLPNEDFGQIVALVIQGPPLVAQQEKELLNRLKQQLHTYEIPKKLMYLPHFPRTDTGKPRVEAIKAALANA